MRVVNTPRVPAGGAVAAPRHPRTSPVARGGSAPNRGRAVAALRGATGRAARPKATSDRRLRATAQRRCVQPVALQQAAEVTQFDAGVPRRLRHVEVALLERLGQKGAIERFEEAIARLLIALVVGRRRRRGGGVADGL